MKIDLFLNEVDWKTNKPSITLITVKESVKDWAKNLVKNVPKFGVLRIDNEVVQRVLNDS